MSRCDPAWLASQRWFRSKQRPIADVDEIDRAPITDRAALAVIEVTYRDGGDVDRYLAPLVDDHEPDDDEGAWRALAAAIASGATLPASGGRFEADVTATGREMLLGERLDTMAERRLRVEQSNTSIVLGERLILKLYRLLEPGANPDVEVGAFLTDAGFTDTPAVAGALTYVDAAGARAAAAMVQSFVPSRGDAWSAVLTALATDPDTAIHISADLGGLTQRLHAALASRPHAADFPSRPATLHETNEWRSSAERQLALALASLTGDARARLTGMAPRITNRLAGYFDGAAEAPVSRVHGDYHLGQVLARIDGGYSVIDFEGEPARPLAERRRATSPLRDVAGMLRSLDYAARTAANGNTGFDVDAWLLHARAAFLEGYGEVATRHQRLLDAFELEKACYEVRYEASNRPAWTWLPLAALERLAGP